MRVILLMVHPQAFDARSCLGFREFDFKPGFDAILPAAVILVYSSNSFSSRSVSFLKRRPM